MFCFLLFKQKNKIKLQALDFMWFLQGYIHLKNQMKLSEQSFHDVTSHFLGSHPLSGSWLSTLLSGSLAFHNLPKHASWIHFLFSFCSLSVLAVLELSALLLIQDSGSSSQPTLLLQILRSMCCSLKQTLAICTTFPLFVFSLSLLVGNCVCQGQCVRWTFSNSFLYSFGHDLIKWLHCVM